MANAGNTVIQEFIDDKKEEYDAFVKMASNHEQACGICKIALDTWNIKKNRSGSYSLSDNYKGANLDLRLSKDDTISKDVGMFIEYFDELAIEHNFSYCEVNEHVSGRWIQYHYQHNTNGANIWVFFHYNDAESCKVVGTGKFVEKLKRVCT